MKEYYVFEIYASADETENRLNELAREGWRLVCSYAKNTEWLIMERDKNICKKCGK